MRISHSRHAFTLIELSIVLVIIGLIVGGVLVGRDLIEAAKVRSTVSQIEKYSTAVNTFRLKYNCIPGDCAKAVEFGLGTAMRPGGHYGSGAGWSWSETGNGSIYPGQMSNWYDSEILNFWYHLKQAGLIDGNYKGWDWSSMDVASNVADINDYLPTTKTGTNSSIGAATLGLFTSDTSNPYYNSKTGNAFFIGSYGGAAFGSSLTAPQAFAIDSKVDDGLPGTGMVVTVETLGGTSIPAAISFQWGCYAGGPPTNVYDVTGAWKIYDGSTYQENPLNPNHPSECGLAFYKAW